MARAMAGQASTAPTQSAQRDEVRADDGVAAEANEYLRCCPRSEDASLSQIPGGVFALWRDDVAGLLSENSDLVQNLPSFGRSVVFLVVGVECITAAATGRVATPVSTGSATCRRALPAKG